MTENRLRNVISKIGDVKPNDMKKLAGLLTKDALGPCFCAVTCVERVSVIRFLADDFRKDNAERFDALTAGDKKIANTRCASCAARDGVADRTVWRVRRLLMVSSQLVDENRDALVAGDF